MKFEIATLFTAAVGLVSAYDDVQSKPFTLSLISSDKKVDGSTIGACHTGAGFESLCYGKGQGQTLYFNASQYDEHKPNPNGHNIDGKLIFNLPIGNGAPVSSPMSFQYDYSTNVVIPMFTVTDDVTYVSFNDKGYMVLHGYVDDTVTPPKPGPSRELPRWYACTTYYTAYTYPTLSWVMGNGKPENPSCVPVTVKRTFLKK